jgi:bla regulator protein blaR1
MGFSAVSIFISMGLIISVKAAQTMGSQPARSPLAFDIASIRPDKSTGRPKSDFPIGPGRPYTPRGGIFRSTHVSLFQYIGFAYQLTHSQMEYLAQHVPDWVTTEGFDITARSEGKPSKDQLRLMMRSLLADRFKLAIHKQDRQVPVLALVLAKSGTTGPYLLPHSSDPPCPNAAPPAEARETVSGGFPLACHGIVALPPSVSGRMRVGARDVSLSYIADSLSGSPAADLGLPLIDGTGLAGKFDFALEWSPELHGPLPPDETFHPDLSGPGFREALREQLGLKLQSRKGTVAVFVIDRVDRPTPN